MPSTSVWLSESKTLKANIHSKTLYCNPDEIKIKIIQNMGKQIKN